ncbi:MAG: response regulator [Pirellulaceae bacterium]
MNSRIRIAVADDEPDMQEYFEKILTRMGHIVVSVAENGAQLVEHCRTLKPELVISDINMPQLDGIEAAVRVFRENPIPFILVSGYHDQSLIERAEADHVMSYLIKPIKQADLEPAIAIAMRRFAQFLELRKEADDLRQALADRKQIERAKGILMKRTGLDEPASFRRLQKLASEKNLKLAEIAVQILNAEEAFAPLPTEGDGR